jgi:3-oxoacyl-[acyl-carrier protein] reductase
VVDLDGRRYLVTGATRREGIAFAVVGALVARGARVVAQAWPLGDAAPLASDPAVSVIEADLEDAAAPAQVVTEAAARLGGLDGVVAAHAHSTSRDVWETDGAELDLAWAVNARASFLLAQAFGRVAGPSGGSVLLFTSGQHLGPMADEAAYAVSKGAIQQMTLTLADALAEKRVAVNALNPGPVDTGWATEPLRSEIRSRFPGGSWTTATQIADVVAWLLSDEARIITGQVLNMENGFRRT